MNATNLLSEGARHVRADGLDRFKLPLQQQLLGYGASVGRALLMPISAAYRVCAVAGTVRGLQGVVAMSFTMLLIGWYILSVCIDCCCSCASRGASSQEEKHDPYYSRSLHGDATSTDSASRAYAIPYRPVAHVDAYSA